MAVLVNFQDVSAPFGNAKEKVCVEYNFASDTGAVADYDVLQANGALLCFLEYIEVLTGVTSAGACNISLGKGAGGSEFAFEIGKSRLALGDILVVNQGLKLADNEKISMGIKVAALTAGKLKFVFAIEKA